MARARHFFTAACGASAALNWRGISAGTTTPSRYSTPRLSLGLLPNSRAAALLLRHPLRRALLQVRLRRPPPLGDSRLHPGAAQPGAAAARVVDRRLPRPRRRGAARRGAAHCPRDAGQVGGPAVYLIVGSETVLRFMWGAYLFPQVLLDARQREVAAEHELGCEVVVCAPRARSSR